MIPDYTSQELEDLSFLHMDDYTRKTILSKVGDFGTGFPRIVQDNARSFTSMRLTTNEKKIKKTKKIKEKAKNRTRKQITSLNSPMIPAEFFQNEDRSLYNTPLTKPQERWSNGIMDDVKDTTPAGSRVYRKKRTGKNLTAALARDLNISSKALGAHTRLLPLDEVSLNSIRTNPQHYLIRPERIPSNECLSWNSLEGVACQSIQSQPCQSIQSQPKAPSQNFLWEPISRPLSEETPS
jgi:hypothetical protein